MKGSAKFIMITFIVSWLLWLPAVLNRYLFIPDSLLLFSMFANMVPSVIGIIFLNKYHKGWYKNKLKVKVNWMIVLTIIVYIPLQGLVSYLLTKGIDTNYTENIQWSNVVLFVPILFIGGPLGEEFGWRGFLQDALTEKNMFRGTLILGLVWSLWHLPLFFIEGTVQSHIPFLQFMLQNTLFAFYYTWFYNRTHGSIIWMIIFHAVANVSAAMFPYWQSAIGRWIGFVMLLICYLLLPKREKRLGEVK